MKVFKSVRQKGVTGLAWASLVFAVVGGALAAGMWIGDTVVFVLNASPIEWLPELLLFAALVALILDLILDGVPNWLAIVCAILLPSVARATFGKFGATVGDFSGWVLSLLDDVLVQWVGTNSSTGLAWASIIAALLMARRVIKKSAGMGM